MNQVTKSKTQQTSDFLDRLKSQVELALPKHMNADRMCRLAMTCFSTNEKLKLCSLSSIAACVMTSAQLGLEIGVNGQAYMIPYGDTATFVPGWKGLMELLNRSGNGTAWTGAVFDGDFFEWQLGSDPKIVHRPNGEHNPDKITHFYAVGRPGGSNFPVLEVWTNERIRAHFKKHNKVGMKHYAHNNWEMYARKVVLLQVLKYLPQSVELNTAVEASHKAEAMPAPIVEGTFLPSSTGSLEDMTAKVKADRAAVSEPDQGKADDIPPAPSLLDVTKKRIDDATDEQGVLEAISMASQDLNAMTAKDRTGVLKKMNDYGKKKIDKLKTS